jgi:hypothetical protein
MQWPESRAGDRVSEGIYTLVISGPLSPRLSAFAETFGAVPVGSERPGRVSLDGGFTYLLRENLQLDISGGVGLDADADDWFLGAGASVRVPR